LEVPTSESLATVTEHGKRNRHQATFSMRGVCHCLSQRATVCHRVPLSVTESRAVQPVTATERGGTQHHAGRTQHCNKTEEEHHPCRRDSDCKYMPLGRNGAARTDLFAPTCNHLRDISYATLCGHGTHTPHTTLTRHCVAMAHTPHTLLLRDTVWPWHTHPTHYSLPHAACRLLPGSPVPLTLAVISVM
jgi:hypothetical protein